MSIKVTILGSGTSTGVPELGCGCEVCRSTDPRDARLRSSALIESGDSRLLIDCGPDFRTQMLHRPFQKIDAVLLTHKHYDHTGGLDDLRPFCRKGDIPVYADGHTVEHVKSVLPYCFSEVKYPGVPNLMLHKVEEGKRFTIGDFEIEPIRVFHGRFPILSYRMGAFAYCEEEGTYAAEHFEDNIDEDTKQGRLGLLMRVQQRIAEEVSAASIGKTMQVVVDREEGDYYIGRTQYDSPEVDPEVLLRKADNDVEIGQYYMVEITGADEFDLYGKVVL